MTIIKIAVFATIIFVNIGCVDYFRRDEAIFNIINESDYNIKLSYYFNSDEVESIAVKSKETFNTRLTSFKNGSQFPNPVGNQIDSIVVNFEDKKALIFYCINELTMGFPECRERFYGQKNPYDLAESGEEVIHKRTYIPTYTIRYDNTDFERAIPL